MQSNLTKNNTLKCYTVQPSNLTLLSYVAGHFDPLVNSFPNQVSLFHPRSTCFNPGWVKAGTKHRSQVVVVPIKNKPNHLQVLTLGL